MHPFTYQQCREVGAVKVRECHDLFAPHDEISAEGVTKAGL